MGWVVRAGACVAVAWAVGGCDPAAGGGADSGDPQTGTATDDGTSHSDFGPLSDPRPLILPPLETCDDAAEAPASIRVLNWNIASGRVSSLSAVTDVIAEIDADVVVIQEVDVVVRRTGNVDQPRVLADALGYEYAFAASIEYDGGDFGLMFLSRLPFTRADRISLDSAGASEVRIGFDVSVCAGPRAVRLVDVHADYIEPVNVRNLTDLAATIGAASSQATIVAGDFNATPDTAGVQAWAQRGYVDVFEAWDPGPTRNGERIDYVFTDPTMATQITGATRLETPASDHAALFVDVTVR